MYTLVPMHNLVTTIQRIVHRMNIDLYVVGGAVRDRGLGRSCIDIDFATAVNGLTLCRDIAAEIGATFVPLDAEEQVARLVYAGLIVDFARFKSGAQTIGEDLGKRDFTINSIGMHLDDWLTSSDLAHAIDPFGGREDLHKKCIRMTSARAVADDPLRMIRGFRLLSLAGFVLDPQFLSCVANHKSQISQVSAERILYELHLIMKNGAAGDIIRQMAECGLLAEVRTELTEGQGVQQPASHHLDVFAHNLESLRCMDEIVRDPAQFFPNSTDIFREYLKVPGRILWLKWAALCHDIGKTMTYKEEQGKITFYNHDQKGARLFQTMARRLTFSNRDSGQIGLFISQHMRPFFLCNNLRAEGVSTKACLRLAKVIGDDLPGLFMVAMADSLAGKGEKKPERMEEELGELFQMMHTIIEEKVKPVLCGPPLLTGHDLIQAGLAPGPLFREILEEVEQLHVEGEMNDKEQALQWLGNYLQER